MTKTKPRLDPHDPGPMPEAQTKCIHCDKPFKTVGIPIIGESLNAKQQRAMKAMGEHMYREHPEVMSQIMMQAAAFNGLLVVSQFNNLEPELEHQKDLTRHEVHMHTQRVRVTDEMIAGKVSQLFDSPEIPLGIPEATLLMTWLRDQYEERGYAAKTPSSVILPS